MTKFVIENDNHKEENRFLRTVGDSKDMSIANDNYLRNNCCNKSLKLPKVILDREKHSMKRKLVCMQEEEEERKVLWNKK